MKEGMNATVNRFLVTLDTSSCGDRPFKYSFINVLSHARKLHEHTHHYHFMIPNTFLWLKLQ